MIYFSQRISSEKSGDSFKRQEESWRRAYAVAGSLRERFPQIDQVVVDMVFEDVKKAARTHTDAQLLGFRKGLFAFPCCPGRFVSMAATTSIPDRRAACGGRYQRHGDHGAPSALGATRSEDTRCLLRMHYRIQIHYKVPVRRN
jgi:hypothetical protein